MTATPSEDASQEEILRYLLAVSRGRPNPINVAGWASVISSVVVGVITVSLWAGSINTKLSTLTATQKDIVFAQRAIATAQASIAVQESQINGLQTQINDIQRTTAETNAALTGAKR